VTTRSAKRSYNTAAIVWAVAGATDGDPTHALMRCVNTGVATVAWSWSKLRSLAEELGLPLKKVNHPVIEDGDIEGPWVGEDWKAQVRQEAVPEVKA
jgi:hypothetical protein